jgi:hypothetical protein
MREEDHQKLVDAQAELCIEFARSLTQARNSLNQLELGLLAMSTDPMSCSAHHKMTDGLAEFTECGQLMWDIAGIINRVHVGIKH